MTSVLPYGTVSDMDGDTRDPSGTASAGDQRRYRENWLANKRAELGDEAFEAYVRQLKAKKPETARRAHRRYAKKLAERTTPAAGTGGTRWTISDARTALDSSLTVPQAAQQIGRSGAAVKSLRQRWRKGTLPAELADQLPLYREPGSPESSVQQFKTSSSSNSSRTKGL